MEIVLKLRKSVLLFLLCVLVVINATAKSYVAIEDVKVRVDTFYKSKVIGTIKKGTTLPVAPISDNWGKVTWKNKPGYVASDYFDEAPAEAQEPEPVAPAQKGLSTNDKKTIAFIIGFIVFLFVVRKLLQLRSGIGKGKSAKSFEEANAYQPKFWYHCRHCRVTVRKESQPIVEGCFKAPDHHWLQLAEFGTHKYLCKKCGLAINTKSVPLEDDCQAGEMHFWNKLPV